MSAYWPADESEPIHALTAGELLRDVANRVPDRVALVAAERRWTYAQLRDEAETAARALLARFAPGERIAAWANNLPEWVILELAAGLAGITVVTVNPALRERELTHVLGRSKAAGVFMIPEYRGTDMAGLLATVRPQLPALREVVSFTAWDAFLATAGDAEPPPVDPGAPLLILFTSGTTGTPKGALLHHRGIINNARLSYARMGVRTGFVHVNPMPLFHAAGCAMCVFGSLSHAGTLVLPPHFDPGLVFELTQEHRAECVGG